MKTLCFQGGENELNQAVWSHLSNGGKRLRTRLALLALEALDADIFDGIAWSAACEFLHNASLIHDDIQDGDRLRRGHKALWVRYGQAQAINAGDLCITLGYSALAKVPVSNAERWRLTELISRASQQVVYGQSAEFGLIRNGVPTFDDYRASVEGKTAALFSLPVEGAALIAGQSPEAASALAKALSPIGVIYQIQDDILDLYGDNGREMPGSDLAQEAKASALVIEHLRLFPNDSDWLLKILFAPRSVTSSQDIRTVIERFSSQGALAAVWERIDELKNEVETNQALAKVSALRILAHTFIEKALEPVSHTRPAETFLAHASNA